MRTASSATCMHASEANSFAIPASRSARSARVEARRGVEQQQPGRVQLGRHVGQQVADRLVLPDRLAERLALLRVRERVVERGLGDAHRAGGHLDPADLQARHHLREAAALLAAEQRVAGTRDPSKDSSQLSTPL